MFDEDEPIEKPRAAPLKGDGVSAVEKRLSSRRAARVQIQLACCQPAASYHCWTFTAAGPAVFLCWFTRAAANNFLHTLRFLCIKPTLAVPYTKAVLPRVQVVNVVGLTE